MKKLAILLGFVVAIIAGSTARAPAACPTPGGSGTDLCLFSDIVKLKSLNGSVQIRDGADETKQADLDASGISASTQRVFAFPDLSGTFALTANNLGVFASTTSAQLAGVISNETGSGALVFGTSPSISGSPTINGDNIGSFTWSDSSFFLRSGADATAKARFSLTGITTATTRVYTAPDADGTLAISAASPVALSAAGQISVASIPNSSLATMNSNTIKGNNTGGAATPSDLTIPQLTALFTTPTQQILTSGTNATYTTPSNARYIRVRLCAAGGGGGGGSGSSTGGSDGTAASETCFGTNATACTTPLVQANGGSGGNGGGQGGNVGNPAQGGVGGAAGTGAFAVAGNPGVTSSPASASFASNGTPGGAGAFGGAGAGGDISTPANPAAGSYCSGGGGGQSISNAGGTAAGAGGGAGGYSEKYIASPAASYKYTIGANGTGGSAGTGGTGNQAGAAGGPGVIIVDEFYQ